MTTPNHPPFSPAAQAVIDAVLATYSDFVPKTAALWVLERPSTVAALRAAADQVVPEEPLHGGDQRWMYERDARQDRRKKLLAIAAELENNS
jgi:hypothetical protein